jgi:hypothetical protein
MAHLPNKITKIGNNVHSLLETLFPYDIVVVNPNDSPNDKIIELIFTKLECPICGNKIHYNDCWNKKKELRATFVRTCHWCLKLFLLIGRFDREEDFISAYRFYDNNVYSKIKNEKEKGRYENTNVNPNSRDRNPNSRGDRNDKQNSRINKQNSRVNRSDKQNNRNYYRGDPHI